MQASKKIAPTSSNRSSISRSERLDEGIILNSFKLKLTGTGAARNTLVESDSLSSYSWPEETTHQEEKVVSGASRDSSENRRGADVPNAATVLRIENDQNAGKNQEPTYVEAYMKFMYWTCVSPFNPSRRLGRDDSSSWSDFVLKVIQKIIFSTTIGLSFVKSFFQVKLAVIMYMAFPDMESFIDMMFYIMNAGTKVYCVYIFALLQTQFSKMLNSLDKLRDFRMKTSDSNNIDNSTMRYAIRLGLSSIVMTFIQSICYSDVIRWTPQKSILFHSYTTALGLLAWSQEDIGNGTWHENIQDEYGNEINTTNILLGAFGFIIHFCSSLHNEATGDLIQTQAETVKMEMQCLQNLINTTGNDEKNVTLSGLFREDGEWEHSRILSQSINTCNDTLDAIMKYKHVNNLMLYVFFVLNFFDGEHSVAYSACLLYDICKSSYTYRIAAEASTLNESKRDWIRRLAWKSTDNEFRKKVPLLLGEIKEKPVGMGKGQFMINESFLYRFLGWVGSVFVLQAQSREGRTEQCV